MISDYSKAKRENRLEDESCVKAGIAGMIGNFLTHWG